MLYIIGLGLGDAKDVTVKGLEMIGKSERVYLESYTSILSTQLEELEQFYRRPLIIADRELVENEADSILPSSPDENVALLVVGDPFGATTHTDLVLRAWEKKIEVKVIHNASILTAIGCCGLQLYSFGETVSIPYWSETWQPDSFYPRIVSNRERGLHTLCLLDIRVKEPTLESIFRQKKDYQPSRFMSVAEAVKQLLSITDKAPADTRKGAYDLTADSLCVGLARIGSDNQRIVARTLKEMAETDLGPPLHCLVIPAKQLHPIETEFLQHFAKNIDAFKETTSN